MIKSDTSFYIQAILTRSLIEHLLVVYYVWSRYCESHSDEVAQRYYQDYFMGELIKRNNYSTSHKYEPISSFGKLFNKVICKLRETNILKDIDIEKYRQAWNEFDLNKISKYIRENKPDKSYNLILKERLPTLLEYYNYFSSYVHGGPTSDLSDSEISLEEKELIIEEFRNISDYSVYIIQFMIAIFLSFHFKDIETELVQSIENSMKE